MQGCFSSSATINADGTQTVVSNHFNFKGRSSDKITVKHGFHTYGTSSQEEYDTIYQIAEDALRGIDQVDLDEEYGPESIDYLVHGKRIEHQGRAKTSSELRLRHYNDQFAQYLEQEIPLETILEMLKIEALTSTVLKRIPADEIPPIESLGYIESAYHGLALGLSGPSVWAHSKSLFF